MLAAASGAVILGFNVRPVGDARAAAEREGVEIRGYSIIYKALDDLRDAMTGMLEPEEVEDAVGQLEVRATFKASKIGTIAGCYVTEGKVTRGAKVRVVRDGTVIYDTTVATLRRVQDDVREVAQGFECGIVLDELPGRQGRRRPGGLRDAQGRARARSSERGARTSRCCSCTCASRTRRASRPSARTCSRSRRSCAGATGSPSPRSSTRTLWQRSTLAAALTGGSLATIETTVDGIERWLESRFPENVRIERILSSFDEVGELR